MKTPRAEFETLSNFRAVAGVAPGLLFRSDDPSGLGEAGIDGLRARSIRLVCDLRSAREVARRPHRVLGGTLPLVHIPLHDDSQDLTWKQLPRFLFGAGAEARFHAFTARLYHHIAFERTAEIRRVCELLSQPENVPALLHCTAGRDRTGFLAALVQTVAGVPYEAVVADYLLSNERFELRRHEFVRKLRRLTLFQVPPDRLHYILTIRRDSLDAVFERLRADYGSVEGYLENACGVAPATIAVLRARFTATASR
jgi:protein-tyrosine phosphatase